VISIIIFPVQQILQNENRTFTTRRAVIIQ
jgi:hypothetical protein